PRHQPARPASCLLTPRRLNLHPSRARRRTTVADRAAAAGRPDLLGRDFTAPAPNQRWVADFTYVPIATGTVYAAFIVDCFSRFIVGWPGTCAPTCRWTPWRWHCGNGMSIVDSLCTTRIAEPSTCQSDTPNVSPRLEPPFPLAVKEIRTTTRSPRRWTACTRRRSTRSDEDA